MKNILKAIGNHVRTQYEAQHDPEGTRIQSEALRIFGSDHRITKRWTQGELTDTEFHAKALDHRNTTAGFYPDAQFKLGDSVRFEQKACHIYGYVREVELWKGMFLYKVDFIDGVTLRAINEAHLHAWHTTPIQSESN